MQILILSDRIYFQSYSLQIYSFSLNWILISKKWVDLQAIILFSSIIQNDASKALVWKQASQNLFSTISDVFYCQKMYRFNQNKPSGA